MTELQMLPPLSAAEYEALKADIAARGQHTPAIIDEDGALLDGFHRQQACEELGVQLITAPRSFPSRAHAKAFALAANMSRRHLSPEQAAELRETVKAVYFELRQEGCTQPQAAGLLGVAQPTGASWEGESNITGNKAFPDQRLSVPRDHRDVIWQRHQAGEPLRMIAADYKISRQRAGQIVRQVQARLDKPQPRTSTPAWPDSRFSALVIDPPWPMPKIEREVRPDQSESLDYATLPVDCGEDKHQEMPLCCLHGIPVPALADQRGAHIYLWVTHRFLPAGLALLKAWEVRYQCVMTWRKNVGPTPFSWMYDTEHVLFGRVGDLPLAQLGLRLSFDAPVRGHSVKPDVFYERVIAASPDPRLEVFARRERDGFTAWGNEVASADV